MIPREHLALWLGVSEGRVSQMMRSLVDTWGLVERRGKRGDTRYTLSAEGIRYVTHRDRAQLPTTQGIWSTALTTRQTGPQASRGPPHRDVGAAAAQQRERNYALEGRIEELEEKTRSGHRGSVRPASRRCRRRCCASGIALATRPQKSVEWFR